MSPCVSPAETATRAPDGVGASTDMPLRDGFAGPALAWLTPSPSRPGVLPPSPSGMARVARRPAGALMPARAP